MIHLLDPRVFFFFVGKQSTLHNNRIVSQRVA